MGIYERDYMKSDEQAGSAKRVAMKEDASYKAIPLWNRIKFKLWLLLHPGRTKK